MKAIVATDQSAEAAGITLTERPEPKPAINDVVVEVHASGFVPAEWEWPSTWVDRSGHDRAQAIIGHEFAGVVTSLGYGTTGLSLGQRVFGITDWHRDGTLAEYAAVEARNLAPLPGNVDFTVGASLPISGLTAWQGLFQHGRLQAGQSVLIALDLFHADRFLERRPCLVNLGLLQLYLCRSPGLATNLVADTVHHRLAEVGLQRPLPGGLEHLNPVKRLEQGFLDKVLRVGHIARPSGQSSLCPTLQPGKVPREKLFESLFVPAPEALNEMERGLRLAGRRGRRGIPAFGFGRLLRKTCQFWRHSSPAVSRAVFQRGFSDPVSRNTAGVVNRDRPNLATRAVGNGSS